MQIVNEYYAKYVTFFSTIVNDVKKSQTADESFVRDLYISNSIIGAFLNIEKEISPCDETKEILDYQINVDGALQMLFYKQMMSDCDDLTKEEIDTLNEIESVISTWTSESEVINEILEFVLEFSEYILKTLPIEYEVMALEIEKQNQIFFINTSSKVKEIMFRKIKG